MATTTPNYLWSVPTSSDLVKNGATAIETLGDSVDASLWSSGYGQAGKNKIINGDFGVWQRGTTFSSPASSSYLADRFYLTYNGSGATRSITQQTFTPGTAPVAGYEGSYFLRYARTVAGTAATADRISQRIEDVRTFAGQTMTVSFWAKVDSGTSVLTVQASQNFGSGGSGDVGVSSTVTLTTTWTRYSVSLAIPSISGKTIGTNSAVDVQLRTLVNTIQTFDFWGVQAEYGSSATPFQTASGGSLQAELAMCQRYYYRQSQTVANAPFGSGMNASATGARIYVKYAQPLRVNPTAIEFSTLQISDFATYGTDISGVTLSSGETGVDGGILTITGGSGFTTNQPSFLRGKTANTSYIAFSAEL